MTLLARPLGLVLLLACGRTSDPNTILVGQYGSFTGSEATFGLSGKNGIALAVREINAAGGIKGKQVRVNALDTGGRSQEAGLAVTRLITEDKVVAVLGEASSNLSLAGGRVAQRYGVPMVSPSSTAPEVTEVGDMIFRVCFIDSFQGYVGARFVHDDLKLARAAVLYDQAEPYSQGLKDVFEKELVRIGGEIVVETSYTHGDADYSAQLTSIRDRKPDIIYLPGYYTDVGNIILQARKLGIVQPFLGGDGWDSAQLAKIAGAAVEGSYFSTHYSHQDRNAAVQAFVRKYRDAYGEVPDVVGALGYDAAMVLADAMRRAPSLSGRDIARALAETRDFAGVTGTISIDAHRNARKAAVILVMKDGQPTYVTSIPPP
ncbi:MAG TPA: ABC transporter substrate-binding protein [Haliangiales bacterium]|nr:ABC transporter substrate-binding protein [Haliangiales bacterium]